MNTIHRTLALVSLFGIVAGIAIPAISHASSHAPEAKLAGDCPETSSIVLELDVMTGKVYRVENNNYQLVGSELTVYTGSLSLLRVDLHYSSGKWETEVSSSGGSTRTYETSSGAVRLWLGNAAGEHLIASTLLSAMMTPVVPDIVIRSKPDCPPSP